MNTRLDMPTTRPGTVVQEPPRGGLQPQATPDTLTTVNPVRQDRVELRALELTQLAQQATDMDDSKVARIRDAISAGTYAIDADAIADRLLRFESDLAGNR